MAKGTAVALDVNTKQHVVYAVPTWLRDQQIKVNIAQVAGRLPRDPHPLRHQPIAVVGFGPSLNDTWEQAKDFPFIITCSGAHKFLIERGVIPNWHLEVDPRAHKIALLGDPHPDVEYLVASACHPEYVKHLLDHQAKVSLWHVFDPDEAGLRLLPHGEWAITGGCSAGLRALTMARFLGFTDLHVFGLDGSEGKSGKHAGAHPMQAKTFQSMDYKGVTYLTSPAFLEAARGTFHELDQMTDVKATFYGDGLVQHMAQSYVPKHKKGQPEIGFIKEPLITPEYLALNKRLHRDNLAYGVGGSKYVDIVKTLTATIKAQSILDYGAGKGFLAEGLPFPIWEYDPAIPGKDASPRPAELVICTDVLEHIEPDRLPFVLADLKRCVRKVGYFVIHTGPAQKTLADGRNAHLIQQDAAWWGKQLAQYFAVPKVKVRGLELHVIVGPKGSASLKPALSVLTARGVAAPLALDLSKLAWRQQPYPIACASNVLPETVYRELAETFPPLGLFRAFGGGNRKWSLSQVNNRDQYDAFLNGCAPWKAFYQYVKDPAFLDTIRGVLKAQGIDVLKHQPKLKTRFEFSMLPADGGCLRPHTDIPTKLVTLVVTMRAAADTWEPSYGGGTDVLWPKDGQPALEDYKADFDAFDVIESYAYQPNQGVLFVKTADSWHGVSEMKGPSDALRKTLTINVERAV